MGEEEFVSLVPVCPSDGSPWDEGRAAAIRSMWMEEDIVAIDGGGNPEFVRIGPSLVCSSETCGYMLYSDEVRTGGVIIEGRARYAS
jgi:hypothetical protein